jgi:phosphate transport system substrate-binding protein
MLKKISQCAAVIFGGLLCVQTVFATMTLNGAGATFPYPLYAKWAAVYAREKGVQINYASIGSGGGVRQFTAGTVDFGASDAAMSNEEMTKAGGDVLHIPTVMGAVAVVYNSPEVASLKLDGTTLALIYMGEIKKWNDPKIAVLNPGVSLSDKSITVIHRSDGSGTTDIFTNYLAKVNTAWASKVGAGKSVAWPVGIGGKGNEGVAGAVKMNKGSLGYVELAYAKTNALSIVAMKNRSGNFVVPSPEGTTAAADRALKKMPADFRAEILNQPGKESYPISGFTWILVHKNQSNKERGKELKNFLTWAVTDGQQYASALDYAQLPTSLRAKIVETVNTIE